jgi:hypothetical protein
MEIDRKALTCAGRVDHDLEFIGWGVGDQVLTSV